MRSIVYYFTGTGNSMIAARDIAKEIEGEVTPICSVINEDSVGNDADVIGIVFPVYIWGMPPIVKRFIKKIENIGDKYIFAIATYGEKPGAAINLLNKEIKKRKGILAGGFGLQMPANYIPMNGAIEEEKQQKLFKEESKKIKSIAEYIKMKGQGTKENGKPLYNLLFSHIINNLSASHIHEMDNKFWADEKCNKCGICQKTCPVSNIKMTENGPKWNKGCEQCFACLQWCPQEAIQYGKNTSTRKRYHHPDVKLSDILGQYNK